MQYYIQMGRCCWKRGIYCRYMSRKQAATVNHGDLGASCAALSANTRFCNAVAISSGDRLLRSGSIGIAIVSVTI